MEAPHSSLSHYYGDESNRQSWVRGLFNRSAANYDRVESAMAFGTGSWYRRRALIASGLRPGMRIVDVGVGTGLVAREAANIVGDAGLVTGVDPSPGMLANAKVPAGVNLLLGSAESIPLDDASADFLSMGYALRHLDDLAAAFGEFFRVLKPGGLLCVLEFTMPERPLARTLLKGYMRGVVPGLAAILTRQHSMPTLMRYTWETIEASVPPAVVVQGIESAGFSGVSRHVELGIFSEYRACRPPG